METIGRQSSKKPLLALILVGEGTLTADECKEALGVWRAKKEAGQHVPFGQVVLSLGMVSMSQLGLAVALQRRLARAPGERKPLGVLLLENGLVPPTVIQNALDRQGLTGQKLGELLVADGALRKAQVDALLHFQKRVA